MKIRTPVTLLATGLALAFGSVAQAAFINGGISFFGSYTPQDGAAVPQANLDNATQIAFGSTAVGFGGTAGAFTVIPDLTPVTMYTPLVFVPPTLPGSDLWSVTSGAHTFTFALSTLNVGPVNGTFPGAQSLELSGTGTVSYSGPLSYVDTSGSWRGTFNAGGGTFTWSSSTASVPDGGTTVALLGITMLGLHGLRRRFGRA